MILKNRNNQPGRSYLQLLSARFGFRLYSAAYTFYCIIGNFVLSFIYKRKGKNQK